MINRRHLWEYGSIGGLGEDSFRKLDGNKFLNMGEDEEEEVLPKETMELRTWWRKWLKIS